MQKSKTLAAVLPLFLVLFIDGMGLSLLFPVLNSIIVDPRSHFLAPTVQAGVRDLLYGFIIGIFMICWFFGAAILGDLSDTTGRKKALLICLIGAFLGYLISAIAVVEQSILFLIVGRIIAGFTAGSQPIAQAAIIDISEPERKARNIGLILLALCLGFVVGPILGGTLSDAKLVHWFTFSTPLYFAALISLLNAVFLWLAFHETFYRTEKIKLKFHRAIEIFISAFKHEKIRKLSIMFFIMILGWSNFFTFVPMFAYVRFGFTPLQVSLLLAVLGVGFSIGCGFLVDYLVKRFYMKWIVFVGLLVAAIGIGLVLVIHYGLVLWLTMAPIGMGIAVSYSTTIALYSDQVNENEQGWVMGVSGSIMALCFGISSIFTGYLAHFGAALPIYFAVIGVAASAVAILLIPRREIEPD